MSLITLPSTWFFVPATLVFAQDSEDVYAGAVANQVEAHKTPVDTFGNGVLYNAPQMTGAFPKFGANPKLTRWLGVGGEVSWRASKGDYAALMHRPFFYDFYGMYTPPTKP